MASDAEDSKPLSEQLDQLNISPPPEKPSFSFSIWPPSQRTREAVTNRLIETLSTPSVLSKRYGVLPAEEAAETARNIEEEAFVAAGSAEQAEGDTGIEILQVYSKEISKRMLDAVKTRASSGADPVTNGEPKTEKSDEAAESDATE